MKETNPVERRFEAALFASRWMLVPLYLGLTLSLGMMVVVFFRELLTVLPQTLTMTTEQSILAVLTLIDLTLAANLLLIVIFSGYENFVSKFDVDSEDRPDWMGTVDFTGLKMKLIASIVAISGIYLLKRFMEVGVPEAKRAVTDNELYWLTVIYMSFVVSGVLLALMDWLAEQAGLRAGTRKGKGTSAN